MSLSTDVLSNDPLYEMKLSGRRTGLLCLKQDVVRRGVWGRGVLSSSSLVVLSVVMVVVEVVWCGCHTQCMLVVLLPTCQCRARSERGKRGLQTVDGLSSESGVVT